MIPKERVISLFLEQNVLISEEFLRSFSPETTNEVLFELEHSPTSLVVIPKSVNYLIENKAMQTTDWLQFDQQQALDEKITLRAVKGESHTSFQPTISTNDDVSSSFQLIEEKGTGDEREQDVIQSTTHPTEPTHNQQSTPQIKIISSYSETNKKRTPTHFLHYFTTRYKALERLLRTRLELSGALSLIRIQEKKDKEPVACIGMVYDKQISKNKHIILNLEDPSGSIKCIIKNSTQELYAQAKEITPDEVIGVIGKKHGDIIYGDSILWPDIPLSKELKKAPEEVYAVFMSDTEFGSKMFLEDAFKRFLSWINGDLGSDTQRQQTKKIKYLFLVGDLVNGVGIYPTQEKDLAISDVYKQYEELAKYLRQIPSSISIVACPGNHDAVQLPEPQPPLTKEIAKIIADIPNIILVSNPSWVNFHSSPSFPGFDVLMYHGFSFIYYANAIESIRTAGGQERADLIMKYLLKRRHLAPTHASSQSLPDATNDPLVIDRVPDFFISGHLHQVMVAQYRNITLMNCSAWISKTDFQEKMGIEPKPGRIILVNLQTRESRIINFSTP